MGAIGKKRKHLGDGLNRLVHRFSSKLEDPEVKTAVHLVYIELARDAHVRTKPVSTWEGTEWVIFLGHALEHRQASSGPKISAAPHLKTIFCGIAPQREYDMQIHYTFWVVVWEQTMPNVRA